MDTFVKTSWTLYLKQVHFIVYKLYLNGVDLKKKIKAILVRMIRKAKSEMWLNKAGISGILYLQTIANSFGEGKEAKG